ncbi:MAG TPA: hypothetical protein VK553_09790 [Candidatus Nitrosopolaris rasttigaisensis]|nr:hypothetical protein [Candidatus Nitrosopolaris rasttigaisensis]
MRRKEFSSDRHKSGVFIASLTAIFLSRLLKIVSIILAASDIENASCLAAYSAQPSGSSFPGHTLQK